MITATLKEKAHEDQVRWGGNDNPNNLLRQGQPYEVSEIEMHSSHCKLHLAAFPGKTFNSINFNLDPPTAFEDAARQWRAERLA